MPGVELDTRPDTYGAGAWPLLIRCLVSTTILHRYLFGIYGKDLLLTFWRHHWDGSLKVQERCKRSLSDGKTEVGKLKSCDCFQQRSVPRMEANRGRMWGVGM